MENDGGLFERRGARKVSGIQRFDLFDKTDRTLQIRSGTGGLVTVVCLFIAFLLILSELGSYFRTDLQSSVTVDMDRNREVLITFDITFTNMSCSEAEIDLVDEMGKLHKVDHRGYAEEPTLSRKGPKNIEGCRIKGSTHVPKIKGNLHVAPGTVSPFAGAHIHQVNPQTFMTDLKRFHASHIIHELSFGMPFPGMKNPLQGLEFETEELVRHNYFIELVPTQYVTWGGASILHTHQYSVTNYSEVLVLDANLQTLPGVFFRYDFSPMLIRLESRSKSFLHLLVRLCAIIGGIWVVIGLAFSAYRTAADKLKKKE